MSMSCFCRRALEQRIGFDLDQLMEITISIESIDPYINSLRHSLTLSINIEYEYHIIAFYALIIIIF